jgi:predicted Zn-dependent peptidase
MKEQKIVHEENVQDEDDPDSLLQDGVDMALFDDSHYSTPIDYIHSPLERKQVVEYYRKHYLPGNMALSIVSSASYGDVKKMVIGNPFSHFHSFHPLADREKGEKGEGEGKTKIVEKKENEISDMNKYHPYVKYDRYKGSNGIEIVYGTIKGYSTVQIAVGFRTCAWKDIHDREIMKLIKTIFARGLNGRLYNELREKHGLAYSPSSGTEFYDTMGKITLYTEIESSKLIEYQEGGKRNKGVLPLLFGLIREFIEKGPTAKEWEDVKGYVQGERILAMQKINHFAEYNGKNYWLSLNGDSGEKGDIESYQNHWEKYIQPITLEECRECIRKYFTPSSMCIVLVGSSLPSIGVLEKCVDSYF